MRTWLPLTILWLACGVACGEDDAGSVTVVPRESNQILANPGMGWETFHITSREDRNLPAWLPSTVHYIRWGWNELEPAPGTLNFKVLDDALQRSRESGQKLAFRVMCCSPSAEEPYHPRWLNEIRDGVIKCDYRGETVWTTNLNNPVVLQRHLDFLKRLAEKYNGHPDIDHIDIGSVGWWGEWHMSSSRSGSLPSLGDRNKVVDVYTRSFAKTPRLMLLGAGESLTFAAQRGAGWRADCLGDMGFFSSHWSHMRHGYPTWIRDGQVGETWKTAPVAFETCGDMRDWLNKGWPLRYIYNYALALHASYINNKSAPLPEGNEVRSETERFLRRLGYRFVLRELKHPQQVRSGEELTLAMKWQNVGSAPCYKPYRLAYRLTAKGRDFSTVVPGAVRVNRWQPGSVPVFTTAFFEQPAELPPGEIAVETDRVTLPESMLPGRYVFSLAVVGDDNKPIARLAIDGRAEDGWYQLSEVMVK